MLWMMASLRHDLMRAPFHHCCTEWFPLLVCRGLRSRDDQLLLLDELTTRLRISAR